MSDRPEPWERQEKETNSAFAGFISYRDAGLERSLSATARDIGKSLAMVKRWSSEHGWVSRTEAFDANEDRLLVLRNRNQIRNKATRDRTMGQNLVARAFEVLRNRDLATIPTRDLLMVLDTGLKMERLALGLPETVLGLTAGDGGPVEVAPLTVEQRQERLRQIQAEAGRRLGGAVDDEDDDD